MTRKENIKYLHADDNIFSKQHVRVLRTIYQVSRQSNKQNFYVHSQSTEERFTQQSELFKPNKTLSPLLEALICILFTVDNRRNIYLR